jgi:predicted nucleotidyltransferase
MTDSKNVQLILKAVAGSQGQGLATANSDEDFHGIFSYPTQAFYGLNKPRDSIVRTNPDEAYHELEKYLGLALKCNPTTFEILYMDEYLEVEPEWGQRLIDLAPAFLSGPAVKGAYAGYANAQMKRLRERNYVGSPKYDKLLRHAFRLLNQGIQLYTTGTMRTRVDATDREFLLEVLPTMSQQALESEYARILKMLDTSTTSLPHKPDRGAVNDYLVQYRIAHA